MADEGASVGEGGGVRDTAEGGDVREGDGGGERSASFEEVGVELFELGGARRRGGGGAPVVGLDGESEGESGGTHRLLFIRLIFLIV